MIDLPNTAPKWAVKITKLLKAIEAGTSECMYPIRLENLAKDISNQFFPDSPIEQITGVNLSQDIDGGILKIPEKNGWGILYNSSIPSSGRINFTLAHELGHYLLHREILEAYKECSHTDMRKSSDRGTDNIEAQANEFAKYLLMPASLFREKIKGVNISFASAKEVAKDFNVSLTAAILRWLELTEERAMLIVAKDGFIDWARASEPLFKSGIYLSRKGPLVEVPDIAIHDSPNRYKNSWILRPANLWPFPEEVSEMSFHSRRYDMTLYLLLFDGSHTADEEEIPEDMFDHYSSFTRDKL